MFNKKIHLAGEYSDPVQTKKQNGKLMVSFRMARYGTQKMWRDTQELFDTIYIVQYAMAVCWYVSVID